jgi:hypothetical protein
MDERILQDMDAAIANGTAEDVRKMVASHPDILSERSIQGTWLHTAADRDYVPTVRLFVEECGLDVKRSAI